jgi:uncharacterized delta-60 repeat protein
LDTTFAGDGKVITDVGGRDDAATAVAVDSTGRIVIAGYVGGFEHRDVLVARYLENGDLDTSFSGDGIVTTPVADGDGDDAAAALAIQADGRIVVAGSVGTYPSEDVAVVRYLVNGALDTSFSGDGIVRTALSSSANDEAVGVDIDSEQRIVVAASNGTGTEAQVTSTEAQALTRSPAVAVAVATRSRGALVPTNSPAMLVTTASTAERASTSSRAAPVTTS